MNIKLVAAQKLTKKGVTTKKIKANPYVKLTLKNASGNIVKKSKTLKKCTGDVDFHGEELSLDITKVNDCIENEDVVVQVINLTALFSSNVFMNIRLKFGTKTLWPMNF